MFLRRCADARGAPRRVVEGTLRVCAAAAAAAASSSRSVSNSAADDVLRTRRTFTDDDCVRFGALTGDANPIHYEDEDAGRAGGGVGSRVKGKVVHGMLSASLFGGLLSSAHPGVVYATQELKFRAPVRVGEEIIAEIKLVKRSGARAKYETVVKRARCGEVCVDGIALAILPKEKS
jgi:3-hydroxybutyryl-CoA dehydratase